MIYFLITTTILSQFENISIGKFTFLQYCCDRRLYKVNADVKH